MELPTFALEEGGATVKITNWEGSCDAFGELVEAWVQVEGIPPRWCAWKVFAQVASMFGIMTDVDWSGLFKSFYEKVRIKVATRDPTKIPFERLVEMKKKLYVLGFTVEGFTQVGEDAYFGEDELEDTEGFDELDDGTDLDPTARVNEEANHASSSYTSLGIGEHSSRTRTACLNFQPISLFDASVPPTCINKPVIQIEVENDSVVPIAASLGLDIVMEQGKTRTDAEEVIPEVPHMTVLSQLPGDSQMSVEQNVLLSPKEVTTVSDEIISVSTDTVIQPARVSDNGEGDQQDHMNGASENTPILEEINCTPVFDVDRNFSASIGILTPFSQDGMQQKSQNYSYCSALIGELQQQDVEDDSNEDSDEEMECFDTAIIEKLAQDDVRKNLMPLLQQAVEESAKKAKSLPKPKWGPVLATKKSTRHHGHINIMDKAEAYLKRKNLEVPPTFKGKGMEKCKRPVGSYSGYYTSMGTFVQGGSQGGFEADLGGDGTNKRRILKDSMVLTLEGDDWTLAELQRKLQAAPDIQPPPVNASVIKIGAGAKRKFSW